MDILVVAITLGTIGKVLLAIAVIRVHSHIAHEHSIDKIVLRAIKRERIITLLAIAFILVGYVMEAAFYLNNPLV